jgi:hypothetical protein
LKPAERDEFIAGELTRYLERALAGEGPASDRYPSERKVLERLIPIPTDGFRGVTLTAIMGKLVRADINTGTEFDSINPRGLFERGIRPVLRKFKIPTSSSAPLNVAKNIQVLDEKWAEGRKPEDAAMAAVDYIRRINRHWGDEALRDDLIMMFVQRLVQYANEVAAFDVSLAPLDGFSPVTLGKRLAQFVENFPEGGAIPQFVVGSLLHFTRSTDVDFEGVEGVDASVFGTNTTSNKPADLWERLASGDFSNLYEVTCKKVDLERLDAAVESFARLGIENAPITFICRIPGDLQTLPLEEGATVHRGMTFQFLDLRELITNLFVLLTQIKRIAVMQAIADFVGDPSRPVKTKRGWSKAFGA